MVITVNQYLPTINLEVIPDYVVSNCGYNDRTPKAYLGKSPNLVVTSVSNGIECPQESCIKAPEGYNILLLTVSPVVLCEFFRIVKSTEDCNSYEGGNLLGLVESSDLEYIAYTLINEINEQAQLQSSPYYRWIAKPYLYPIGSTLVPTVIIYVPASVHNCDGYKVCRYFSLEAEAMWTWGEPLILTPNFTCYSPVCNVDFEYVILDTENGDIVVDLQLDNCCLGSTLTSTVTYQGPGPNNTALYTVTITGGVPPYTIYDNHSLVQGNINNQSYILSLVEGTHEITINDADGCFEVHDIEVTLQQTVVCPPSCRVQMAPNHVVQIPIVCLTFSLNEGQSIPIRYTVINTSTNPYTVTTVNTTGVRNGTNLEVQITIGLMTGNNIIDIHVENPNVPGAECEYSINHTENINSPCVLSCTELESITNNVSNMMVAYVSTPPTPSGYPDVNVFSWEFFEAVCSRIGNLYLCDYNHPLHHWVMMNNICLPIQLSKGKYIDPVTNKEYHWISIQMIPGVPSLPTVLIQAAFCEEDGTQLIQIFTNVSHSFAVAPSVVIVGSAIQNPIPLPLPQFGIVPYNYLINDPIC